MRVPDLRFINEKVPVAEVARSLGLRIASSGMIHCWRPERHQHGDRTPSVGVWKAQNRVKCFCCDELLLRPVDLVISVLELQSAGTAARWIAERFEIPELARGKHLVVPERTIFRFGFESDIGFLVQSGLWARLSPTARSIVPVLLELAERVPGTQTLNVALSYRSLSRFSGVSSPNAIADALRELQEIRWLSMLQPRLTAGGPLRQTSTYLLTPRSDALLELANANFSQMRSEIEVQKQLRAEARQRRGHTVTK